MLAIRYYDRFRPSGFQLGGRGNTDSYWVITPASPVLGEAFKTMMTHHALGLRMARLDELSRIDDEVAAAQGSYARIARQRYRIEGDKRALGSTLKLAARLEAMPAAQASMNASFKKLLEDEQRLLHDRETLEAELRALTAKRDVAVRQVLDTFCIAANLSWICVGMHMCVALPCPVCAQKWPISC